MSAKELKNETELCIKGQVWAQRPYVVASAYYQLLSQGLDERRAIEKMALWLREEIKANPQHDVDALWDTWSEKVVDKMKAEGFTYKKTYKIKLVDEQEILRHIKWLAFYIKDQDEEGKDVLAEITEFWSTIKSQLKSHKTKDIDEIDEDGTISDVLYDCIDYLTRYEHYEEAIKLAEEMLKSLKLEGLNLVNLHADIASIAYNLDNQELLKNSEEAIKKAGKDEAGYMNYRLAMLHFIQADKAMDYVLAGLKKNQGFSEELIELGETLMEMEVSEKRKEKFKELCANVIVEESVVSKNAKCPCGSGKKYKNCCGK